MEQKAAPESTTASEIASISAMSSSGKADAKEADNSSNDPRHQSRSFSKLVWSCIIASLLSSILLVALDNTVVANVQPIIVGYFGNIEKLPWISVSFALGAISTTLFWSKLYGQFDNKRLFLSGVILFEIGSAVCGAAPNMDALIVGRAICGIGGVGLYVGAMNIVSSLTSEKERPLYLSFVGLTWGIGTVLGPIIGGAFADGAATWRWAFYINLCVGAAAAPVFIFLLPSGQVRSNNTFMSRASELDLVGFLLSAGAYCTFVMGVSFGGSQYSWKSGSNIALLVLSGVFWAVFAFQQAFTLLTTSEHRLFPVDFLQSWELNILFVQMLMGQIAATIPIYYIPLYFQFVRGDSGLEAGIRLLPYICLLVFGILFNGAMMAKIGYYMPWYLFGGSLVVVGGALLHTVTQMSGVGKVYGFTIILGLGAGVFAQSSFPVAQLKVEPQKMPSAVSFIACAQMSGMTLALAISNTMFLNLATSEINRILPQMSRVMVQQAISGVLGSSIFDTLDAETRSRVLDAIVGSISKVYIFVIVAGGVAVILSMFMKWERLFVQPDAKLEAPSKPT